MKDRTAWKALKLTLYVMIAVAALALVVGCQTVERKPIAIDGFAHCVPTPKQTMLCQIQLREVGDE